VKGFRKKTRRKNLEDIGVDGWIILKLFSKDMGLDGMEWIHLVQDREKLWPLVNTIINL
jgi:hypothetical protein